MINWDNSWYANIEGHNTRRLHHAPSKIIIHPLIRHTIPNVESIFLLMARCTANSVLARLPANHGMDVLLRVQLLFLAWWLCAEEHPTTSDHADHTEDGNVARAILVNKPCMIHSKMQKAETYRTEGGWPPVRPPAAAIVFEDGRNVDYWITNSIVSSAMYLWIVNYKQRGL